MVGVKTSHMTCAITTWCWTLDLFLFRPSALWFQRGDRKVEAGEGNKETRGEGGLNKEDKSKWLMPSDGLLG